MDEQESNKAVVVALLEAADRGDMVAIESLFAPGYHDHSSGGSRQGSHRAAAMAAFEEIARAFPKTEHSVLDLIAEGDRVVLRVAATARQESAFRGCPASGHEVRMTRTVVYRLRDGLIVERWCDGVTSIEDQLNQRAGSGEAREPDGVVLLHDTGAPWQLDASGARYRELGLARVSMTLFRLAPHTRFDTHRHANEQITWVTEGMLFFEVEGVRYELGPGDAIAIPPGVEHAVFSLDEEATALDAWSPPPTHLGQPDST